MNYFKNTIIIGSISLWLTLPSFAAQAEKSHSIPPSPLKLYGQIDLIISSCAAAGITLFSYDLPSKISKIRLGSPAFYNNLAVGDRVISAQINSNKLCLVIERNGLKYSVQLDTSPSKTLEQDLAQSIQKEEKTKTTLTLPTIAKSSNKPLLSSLTAQQIKSKFENNLPSVSPNQQLEGIADQDITRPLSDQNEPFDNAPKENSAKNTDKHPSSIKDVLLDRDLVLIVDHSESMDTNDCPNGLSRWQWCCQQATQLGLAASQTANSVSIIVFNDNYRIFNNIGAGDIASLFDHYHPTGGTILARPLQKEIDEYFRSRHKPLTIVIITDGEPEDKLAMAKLIKETSDHMQYCGEITISFLLISNQVNKEQLQAKLGLIPNSSVQNSGLVDIIPFSTVSKNGVQQTLSEELKDLRLLTNKSTPSKASQFATGISIESKHKHFLLW